MKKFYWLLILFVVLVFGFQNCAQDDGGTTVTSMPSRSEASAFVLASACQIVASCDAGANYANCENSLASNTGIVAALGVPPNTFGSLAALQQAELQGYVAPDSAAANLCATTINQLSCSSAVVVAAYSPSSANPYSGVTQVLSQQSSSCGAIYSGLSDAATNVTATAWPYTALISFTVPAGSSGKTILGYVATSTTAAWISGMALTSPIMVQGGAPGWSGASSAFTVSALYSDGTSGPISLPSNAVLPTAGSGPSTSANIYVGGIFYWQGDFTYSGAGQPSYGDQTGNPQTDTVPSTYDIMCTGTGQTGFHPYAPTGTFNTTGYNYLELDLKPTTLGTTWSITAELPGQILTGATVTLPSDGHGTYGPAPVVGEWATYKIPLANLAVGPSTPNINIYTLTVHDNSTSGPNAWYVNNMKFSGN